MKGEVVSFQLFDVGGRFDLKDLERRIHGTGPPRAPPVGKGTPSYVEFPRPLVVAQRPVEIETPMGPSTAEVVFHFFALGAISVRFRLKVEVASLAELRAWTHSKILIDGKPLLLEAAARELVRRERRVWEAAIIERYTETIIQESYTAYAFQDVGEAAQDFLGRRGREIAGLLKAEDPTRLHESEVKEGLRRWFSYYDDDLAVVDWDAAFLIDPDADWHDILFVLEIANLQLLEFRAYDDYLDDVVARAYDELGRFFRRPGLIRNARAAVHDLSLLRIELAELADEVDNITKFTGDWFLARIYQAAQEKFHLAGWRASVDEKLGTLNKLYSLATEEGDSLRMITLELLIVLLFIVDLLVLFFNP